MKSSVFELDASAIYPSLVPDNKLITDPGEKAEMFHRPVEAKLSGEDVFLPDICHPEPLLNKIAFCSWEVKEYFTTLIFHDFFSFL